MKDLFEHMYMDFFHPEVQLISESKQNYLNHLAQLLLLGQGFLPVPGTDQFIDRELTLQEKQEIQSKIERFLKSLN